MRHKDRCRWILVIVWILAAGVNLGLGFGGEGETTMGIRVNQTASENLNPKDLRGLFSPRMDYEQWTPLGRGDPLKNDPTYDYVPPVLDRVHYWIDPAQRKPDPPTPGETQKTEILLLGVSSKKPSTGTSSAVADSRKDTYDSFLKFVDGPKFNHHQRISRPNFSSFFPSSFFPKNKAQFAKNQDQRVPYTMLMPPPMVTKVPSIVSLEAQRQPESQVVTNSVRSTSGTTTIAPPTTTKVSTIPAEVTLQESNLVYHSSSLGGLNEWKGTEFLTSLTPNPVSYTTRKVKPFNEDIVFQKQLKPPESYIRVQFESHKQNNFTNKKSLIAANSDINFVTVSPIVSLDTQEIMHKGEVSDDNLDVSNTYVKIGKTEAQMHPTALDNLPMLESPSIMEHQPSRIPPNMMLFAHAKHPMVVSQQTPLTLQTIQAMQTMQPPPVTTSPIYRKTTNPILAALENEKATPVTMTFTTETPAPPTSTTIPELTTLITTTTTATPVTTTTASLTTDPLFKHYNQPVEPLKGPLYLIIQGHSKVKTYGPSKEIHGIRVQETNEISDEGEFRVRHLHSYPKMIVDEAPRKGRSGGLKTLKHVIQTGLGAIDFSDEEIFLDASRRHDGDRKEADLHAGYRVAEEKDVTSEKYHKGIVEAARKLKELN